MMSDDLSVKGEKRKHNSLTITKKVELLRKLEKGTSISNLCKEYNVGKSTIYDLKNKKNELFKFFAEADSPLGMEKRKTMRTAQHENVDKVMIEWFRQRRSEGVPLTGLMLMEQAKVFHKSMNLSTPCEYSTGWLRNFKNRHGIRQLSICGERGAADHEAAENFVDEFAAIVEREHLTPEQIYNADETSLFWRYLPNKSLCAANEKTPSGIKHAKERLTVLACANASGTHKLKLLVIGKFAKPRALKNVHALPVHYKYNKRAWITREITKDWFDNLFLPQARAHCAAAGLPDNAKILLVLDNCSAHPPAEELEKENVLVIFLPPNCTSVLQPMDMGVLRSLKCHYKTDFVKAMLHFLDSNDDNLSAVNFVKQFTIKDAIWNIARAWDSIPCDSLKNAWHNLWPISLFLDEEQEEEFEGFHTQKKAVFYLLEYAKRASNKIVLEEGDLEDLMIADSDAPITSKLTDEEIIDSVLLVESESESDDDECNMTDEKMSIDSLISVMDSAINGLEKRSFISEHEIMTLHKIKDKLLAEKPKLLKQKKITEMF